MIRIHAFLFTAAAVPLLVVVACMSDSRDSFSRESPVQPITSVEHFNSIVDNAGDKLLGFDLYANWCMPCRVLTPTLEEIARQKTKSVQIYKVDTDKFPQITSAFGATGIPFVVFVKNRKAVYALLGVQPKETYLHIIDLYAEDDDTDQDVNPDGEKIEGLRVITIDPRASLDNIYVYNGEHVEFQISPLDRVYSIHIPAFHISRVFTPGDTDSWLHFTPSCAGVFRLYNNADNPMGSGEQFSSIIVIPANARPDKKIKQLSCTDLRALRATKKLVLLDVRTPREYYQCHLPDARLFPLEQMENRISELASYQDSPVVIYCLSSIRSSVASEILLRHKFTKVNVLAHGITAWRRQGFETVERDQAPPANQDSSRYETGAAEITVPEKGFFHTLSALLKR